MRRCVRTVGVAVAAAVLAGAPGASAGWFGPEPIDSGVSAVGGIDRAFWSTMR